MTHELVRLECRDLGLGESGRVLGEQGDRRIREFRMGLKIIGFCLSIL